MKSSLAYAAAFAVFLCAPAYAADMGAMMHHSEESGPESVFDDAMMKMHENMGKVEPTGDTDVDFVAGMIPHHQGAIDMAKIELQKGKDPAIRKLAAAIIKAQEDEIAMMKKWLVAHKAK